MSFLSKNSVIGWIFFWKILDVISTYLAVQTVGWGAEINYVINILGAMFGEKGYLIGLLLTIPLSLSLVYYTYEKHSIVTELLFFATPLAVIGNFLILDFIVLHILVSHLNILVLLVWIGVLSYLAYKNDENSWKSLYIGGNTYF